MQSTKPEKPSKLEYFQLSRELNSNWLLYGKYRKLLWYWKQYEEIKKLGKFDENTIINRQRMVYNDSQ